MIPAGTPFSATRGVPRVLRGASLACCSAALTVTAHTTAGGTRAGAPSPALVLVLTVLLSGAGVGLAGRRRGFPAILLALGASQVALHALLSGLGHGHAAGGSALMVVLHAVAAVLIAVLLSGAEDAVFAVAAVLRWLLGAVAVAVLPLPPPGAARTLPPTVPTSTSALLDVLLRRVHGRRAPPLTAV